MGLKYKTKIDLPPVALGAMVGTAVSVVVSIVMSALLAWLISAQRLGQESIGYGGMIIVLISAAAGAFLGVARSKEKRLLTAALTGTGYYLVLLAMNILFFDGGFSGMGETALLVIAGCGVVVLAGLKGGKTRRRPVRKFKNR